MKTNAETNMQKDISKKENACLKILKKICFVSSSLVNKLLFLHMMYANFIKFPLSDVENGITHSTQLTTFKCVNEMMVVVKVYPKTKTSMYNCIFLFFNILIYKL